MFGSTLLAAACTGHAPPAADEATQDPGAPMAGEPSPAPTPVPDEAAVVVQTPDEAAAVVQTMEALAAIHRAHKADCAALARELDAFRAEHREHAAAVKAAYQRVEADEALRQRMRAAMTDVMTAGMACKDAPEFKAALLVLSRKPN